MKADAHLSFNGNCEEAFRYYESKLGGRLDALMKAEGSPVKDFPADKIIHARMSFGGTTIMGADSPAGRYHKPEGIAVTLGCSTPEEAERAFAALTDGGEVHMKMEPTFFAERFGAGRDRFGIPWMVICEKKM